MSVTPDEVSAWMAIAAVLVSLVALGYSYQQSKAAEHNEILKALQGEKESVGFMALQLIQDPKLTTSANRERLYAALCLAFVFESADRARALVLRALQKSAQNTQDRDTIIAIIKDVRTNFINYEAAMESDGLQKYYPRLDRLEASINRIGKGAAD